MVDWFSRKDVQAIDARPEAFETTTLLMMRKESATEAERSRLIGSEVAALRGSESGETSMVGAVNFVIHLSNQP
jgi:hypothetical protein